MDAYPLVPVAEAGLIQTALTRLIHLGHAQLASKRPPGDSWCSKSFFAISMRFALLVIVAQKPEGYRYPRAHELLPIEKHGSHLYSPEAVFSIPMRAFHACMEGEGGSKIGTPIQHCIRG
jgi:hypothetical protein